ncbi:L,D-transpeptidase family protein [Plebeiibacterium marinum]|uniref:L,D-transpeptidase family protein n=1 Tax=Plebeiibacterium marinum TaxID=2992111 RepID=A0AAE3SKY2_9BACT|nr:L,D-transpeptidase family protein [Plebeiobacterium marinum]MCW3807008.1 L,D-transpeptidase family protein [Plebeiobacterium marinum]
MIRNTIYIILFAILFSCSGKKNVIHSPGNEKKKTVYFPENEISDSIVHQLNTLGDSTIISIYKNFSNKLIWKNDSSIQQGINWLKNSRYEGLNPLNFNIVEIDSLYQALKKDSSKYISNYARLDIELTLNIRKCGYRKRFSPINPLNYHKGWNYKSPKPLPHDTIWVNMVKHGKTAHLNSFFAPKHPLYTQLAKELKNIYESKTKHPTEEITDPGFLIQKGDSNQYVLPIKRQLLNICRDSAISMVFDEELSIALKKFQAKHGLEPDGIAGKQTYHYLQWKPTLYIGIIKANIERLRWFENDQFTQGIFINIPFQTLEFMQHDSCMFKTKVIVGKFKNQTEVFTSDINYLVFNPCWTIPQSISTTQILRGAQKDSLYLQNRNMFICTNGTEVPIDSIDFSQYSSSNFPFKVFQRTSPSNALGKVKFMFKNRFSIYLHDTPQQKLFKKPVRTFSHGCIRVENALQLAEFSLNKIDKQNILTSNYLKKGFPVKVFYNKPIPIHITYFTCWFNPTYNEIIYGKDVYLKDYKLINDLKLLR